MSKKRLFWAINLPAELKSSIAGWQSMLRRVPADVKWVEEQNLHLTMKFLGDVDAGRVETLVQAVQPRMAQAGPANLDFAGIGFFPSAGRPRVIWVGVRGEVRKINLLKENMEMAMAAFGLPHDNKKFSPHLTLGRLRSARGAGELAQKAVTISEKAALMGSVQVTTLDLMESKLTARGPHYTLLASVNLHRV